MYQTGPTCAWHSPEMRVLSTRPLLFSQLGLAKWTSRPNWFLSTLVGLPPSFLQPTSFFSAREVFLPAQLIIHTPTFKSIRPSRILSAQNTFKGIFEAILAGTHHITQNQPTQFQNNINTVSLHHFLSKKNLGKSIQKIYPTSLSIFFSQTHMRSKKIEKSLHSHNKNTK